MIPILAMKYESYIFCTLDMTMLLYLTIRKRSIYVGFFREIIFRLCFISCLSWNCMNTSDSLSLLDFPIRSNFRDFRLGIWKNLSLILSLRNLRYCWKISAKETDSHFRSSANPLTLACAECIHFKLSRTSNTCLYSLFSESVSFRVFRRYALATRFLWTSATPRTPHHDDSRSNWCLLLCLCGWRPPMGWPCARTDRPSNLNVCQFRLISK